MSTSDTIVTVADAPFIYDVKRKVTVSATTAELPQTPPPRRAVLGGRPNSATFEPMGDQNNLTSFGMKVFRLMDHPVVRYCFYILPVASFLAIPLILYATVWADRRAGGIRLLGLYIWIEVIWATLWVSKIIAKALPFIFQAICGIISTGVRKYSLVLRATEVPISLFLWACFSYAWFPLIYIFDNAYHAQNAGKIVWLSNLHNGVKATMGVTAIYLAQKILIQLTSIGYHKKQFHDKIHDIKRTSRSIDYLYDASLRRFHDHHPDFQEEDYVIHDSNNLQKVGRQLSADGTLLHFLGDMGWFSDKLTSAFGSMARDITGNDVLNPTGSHAVVEQALDRRAGAEALAHRVFRSLVAPGKTALYERDIVDAFGAGREAEAVYVFAALDRDHNGDVSLNEMLMLVGSIAQERKQLWRGACDIKDSIKILDRVLGFFVFILVVLVYTAFFSHITATQWAQIWSTFTGLSFLFSATAGELFGACILVFVKHPYDIGDRVDINSTELEVVRISLLYSVFRRIDTDRTVQVPNSVINQLWCENVTRSKAMKERLTFSVSAGTSFADIELLRKELEAFVLHPDNRRDFQNEIDIQLLSVGDLKQLDLRVEIRHKSNWANETLRANRRSKFMCALLSAMRKVPIDGPAGSGPAPGTPECPQYAVNITDAESKAALEAFKEKKDSQRLVPQSKAHDLDAIATAISSGLDILPSLISRKGSLAAQEIAETRANPFYEQSARVELAERASNYPPRPHHE